MAVSASGIAENFIGGVATNATGNIVTAIFQKLEDINKLDENGEILGTNFGLVQQMLNNIRNQFEDHQKKMEKPLETILTKMKKAVQEAEDLIKRANQYKESALYERLWNLNFPTQVRAWKVKYNDLIQELNTICSILAMTREMVSNAAPQAELLLQPVPDSGFKGSGIRTAQDKLQTWLTDPHCQSRVIGVYGMGGVGKTSLLKVIYNTYKQQVSGIFNIVIWFTVSQDFQIKDLQTSISKALNLKLEETSTIEDRKMSLYASLRKSNKKFLIVLDDVWRPIDLINVVGIGFGNDNPSKILISSRKKDVIENMGSIEYSVKIGTLTPEEGWELFESGAFTDGDVTKSNIEEGIAREIAQECRGLPLAIIVIAAAMKPRKTNVEWSRALEMMKNADPYFPITHETIDAELYTKLKWSYNDLPDPNLKICFLCCAVFPEDYHIPVESLVQMWRAEGLITPGGTTYFMDIGRQYIDVLVSRGLVEHYKDTETEHLKVHDVLRDMAIFIGRKEQNWFFSAGPHLQNFPSEEETRDCKRISIFGSNGQEQNWFFSAGPHLPMDFKCPNLVSLWLMENRWLFEVPEGFLSNLTCLRVLELSNSPIRWLPSSVGQLGQLEFLILENCYHLNDLPDSICNLSRLQTLNLKSCGQLQSLPSGIGELKYLKHLQLKGCDKLMGIPDGIFQLTSLNTLCLPLRSRTCTVRAKDLKNFSKLVELRAMVKAEIEVGRLGPWSDMRFLELSYDHEDVDVDVAVDVLLESMKHMKKLELRAMVKAEIEEGILNPWSDMRFLEFSYEDVDVDVADVLPQSMKHMKKLEELILYNYQGLSLPNCICDFRNLKVLVLDECHQLRKFPAMEIGSAVASFPALERLRIGSCRFAQTLLSTTGKLPNLTEMRIYSCGKSKELDFGSGSFPMLRVLELFDLPMLQSIGGPSNIWNEGTLPNLRTLDMMRCPLLRKLPLGIEKLSNLKTIRGPLYWWERIVWENDEMKVQLSRLFSSQF